MPREREVKVKSSQVSAAANAGVANGGSQLHRHSRPTPRAAGRRVRSMRRWSSSSDDPFNLSRFTEKHKVYFEQALAELKRGHKSSCWSWYILPTPPFMKNGQEVGSEVVMDWDVGMGI